jgi:hypothetical protein
MSRIEQLRDPASASLLLSLMRDARIAARLRTGALPSRIYFRVPVFLSFRSLPRLSSVQ